MRMKIVTHRALFKTNYLNKSNKFYKENVSLILDARFNKGLIDNCQRDINKYCQSEVIDSDADDHDSDEDDGENSGK